MTPTETSDDMCPNCVTPWKCNGPHEPDWSGGVKFDQEKPRVDLLDPEWLEGTAKVLTFGASKYSKKGECDCLVTVVEKIVKFGPKDYVKAATILSTNKQLDYYLTKSISGSIDEKTLTDLESINTSTWLKILTSSQINVEPILERSTELQTKNLIDSLNKTLVRFVEAQSNYVSTMTITQEELEKDYVKRVTLLLDLLKEQSGYLKHSSTCQSLQIQKTGENNWRNGIAYSRIIAASLRHLFAIMRGEDVDPESGLPHVHHLSCCVMFLSWTMANRRDLDDRWKNA